MKKQISEAELLRRSQQSQRAKRNASCKKETSFLFRVGAFLFLAVLVIAIVAVVIVPMNI